MGNMDNYFTTATKAALWRPGELCIAAVPEQLASLRQSAAIGGLGSATLIEVNAGLDVPDAALRLARVLVIEVDPDQPATLRRVRAIRGSYPNLKIIAAIAHSDVSLVKTLVRQGICDVAELPFQPD